MACGQRKNWIIAPAEPPKADALARELLLARPLAQVLVNRGYGDLESASQFLNPQLRTLTDPFDLPDMEKAVAAVLDALKRGRRLVVYGDYDVDGITSTAFLVKALQAAGGNVASFLPHRMDEGYGLSREGIERCFRELRPELLIAVDCGTTSVVEVAAMKTAGVETIILDHHEPPSELPDCLALVNPKRASDHNVPWAHLASVGVTFKFVHALIKRGRADGQAWAETFDLRDHLDLVATGTIADIVSLTGENRLLTKAGLDCLGRTSNVGLRALMEIAGVSGKISPYHIGYRLGPRLNAAGRLADARAALELLLTEDHGRASTLANLLHEHNADRQHIEEQICAEAIAMVRADPQFDQNRVIVLANQEWHIGVVGIVASRLMQEFHRPSIVIGVEKGLGKGSCRSISGFSMVTALEACSRYLVKHGGHDMAAGLTIQLESVPEFRRAINQVAAHQLSDDQMCARLHIDAEVSLQELDYDFFRQQERLEPCGMDNPKPVFLTRNLRIHDTPRVVGRKHLKFAVTDGRAWHQAIWWNMADAALPSGTFDMAYLAELNSFRGAESIQLNVRDIAFGS